VSVEGFTALHLAVRGGHLSCVKLLKSLGHADVNEGDGQAGRTALHHAVLTDNLAVVGYLLLEVTCTDYTMCNAWAPHARARGAVPPWSVEIFTGKGWGGRERCFPLWKIFFGRPLHWHCTVQ